MTTILIDGHNLLYRVAFTKDLQDLGRSDWEFPLGPVFGFLRVIKATLEKFPADNCIVVWDKVDGQSFRSSIYPDYKATRRDKEKPEALQHINEQMIEVTRILPLLGIKQAAVTGCEGDDLLSELANSIDQGEEVTIISEDKDLIQLVSLNVRLYRPINDELISYNNFVSITGLPSTELFVLRKAIIGDTSDNIKGIKGAGEKTVTKFLNKAFFDDVRNEWFFNSDTYIDDFKAFCSTQKGKTAKKIVDEWDTVELNLKLVDLGEARKLVPNGASRVIKATIREDLRPAKDIVILRTFNKYSFKSLLSGYSNFISPFRRLAAVHG